MRCSLAIAPLVLFALVLAGLPGVAGTAEASVEVSQACVAAAVKAVQKRYEAVADLRARFVQNSQSIALGPGETTTSGTVLFAKPGRMRWSYEKPVRSLVVSDGETLWIYDPELKEAQKLPVGDGYLGGAAIQFLLGQGEMERDFAISGRSCSEHSADLELIPRHDATYEKLRIVANPATGDLLQTTIVDLFGNVTVVSFSDIEVDTRPEAAAFRFEPGSDDRVIDLAPEAP